jgi:small subunit ribosomal protein S5
MAKERRSTAARTVEKDPEWQERVVQTRRVTKVVKGGKKTEFSGHCCCGE